MEQDLSLLLEILYFIWLKLFGCASCINENLLYFLMLQLLREFSLTSLFQDCFVLFEHLQCNYLIKLMSSNLT